MFTLNVYLKLGLAFTCLILGGFLWANYGVWYGIWFVIAGILLLTSYLLLGTVQTAAELMPSGDYDAVEQRLKMTKFPNLLYSTNRAYYYLLLGNIAAQRKQNDKAEHYFKAAEKLNLPSDQEKAMVQFQLANLAAAKKNWNQAQAYFKKAKECKVTDPQLKDQMQQFEKALKQRGQLNMSNTTGRKGGQYMQQGGKRRRPKMR